MLTAEQADAVVTYIRAVEECKGHHQAVLEQLKDCGFSEVEVDDALKALGQLAGRDCGIL